MLKWKEAAALAAMQYGLLALWQAKSLGITRQELEYRCKRHGWTRVRRGVVLLPGHPLSPMAKLKAAELAFAGQAVAVGRAGAFAWGWLQRLHQPLEFLVAPRCPRRPEGTRVRESELVVRFESVIRQNIRVLPAELVICTAGWSSTVAEMKRMISTADRTRACPRSAVREAIAGLPYLADRRVVVQALSELDGEGLPHSELERLGRRRLADAGFEPHGRPHLVLDDAGRRVGELDIAFLDEKVGIPIQGPHHLDEDQRRADDDQRHKLELLGWHLVPADEHRLTYQPEIFVRQVRDALRARRGRTA